MKGRRNVCRPIAWVVLLTFLFSMVMPTNLMAGNSRAEAANPRTDVHIYATSDIEKKEDIEQIKKENPAITDINFIQTDEEIAYIEEIASKNKTTGKHKVWFTLGRYDTKDEIPAFQDNPMQSAINPATYQNYLAAMEKYIDKKNNQINYDNILKEYDLAFFRYFQSKQGATDYVNSGKAYHLDLAIVRKTTGLTIQKNWIGPKPDTDLTFTVEGMVEGKEAPIVTETVTLKAASDFAAQTIQVPVKYCGREVFYSVTENPVEGYDVNVTRNNNYSFTVTNTIQQGTVNVSGNKYWAGDTQETRPESIEVDLFRDGQYYSTTKTALDWTYSFNNLPKYAVGDAVADVETADGHPYVYTVQEKQIENYVATYKQVDATTVDITNTYVDSSKVWIFGQKHWVGGTAESMPDSITVKLIRTLPNSQEEPVVMEKNVTAEMNWAYDFGKLPKYDSKTKINYIYTVEEEAVKDYTATVIGYDIINVYNKATLGDFAAYKTVTGNTAPAKFQFRLIVKATMTTLNDELQKKAQALQQNVTDAEAALTAAQNNLTDRKTAFVSGVQVATGSEYQYVLRTENANYAVTSPSELAYEIDSVEAESGEVETTLLESIIDAIVALADNITTITADILHSMPENTGNAIVMNRADAQNLMDAQAAVRDAQNALDEANALYEAFNQKITTPAAITVTMTPDDNGLKKGMTERVEAPELTEDGVYEFEFELFADTGYSFHVEATTGAEVTYEIIEVVDTTDTNYKGTLLNSQKLDGTLTTGEQLLTTRRMYVFTNNYATSTDPDPIDPDPTPIPDPTPKPPTPPVVPIDDEDVPQGEPEVDITDSDVPQTDAPVIEETGEAVTEVADTPVALGDAPATGDSSNPVAFAMALLAAGLGLAGTRRKMN